MTGIIYLFIYFYLTRLLVAHYEASSGKVISELLILNTMEEK